MTTRVAGRSERVLRPQDAAEQFMLMRGDKLVSPKDATVNTVQVHL